MEENKELKHPTEQAAQRAASTDEKNRISDRRRKAYTVDTVRYILTRSIIIAASAAACAAELVAPVICYPLSLFCLCAACVRLGRYLERNKSNA